MAMHGFKTMPLKQAVEGLEREGYLPLPMHGPKQCKQPGREDVYRTNRGSLEDVLASFESAVGIGVLMGGGANLEVLDVDTKNLSLAAAKHPRHQAIFDAKWGIRSLEHIKESFEKKVISIVEEMFGQDIYIVKTPSGGMHFYFNSPESPEPSEKEVTRLAFTQDKEVLIEYFSTKPDGSGSRYVVCPPSEGYHAVRGDFSTIPKLSNEQRLELFRRIRALCVYSYLERQVPAPQKTKASSKDNSELYSNTDSTLPINWFNDNYSPLDVVIGEGWEVVSEDTHRVYVKRPGSEAENSGNFHKQMGTLISHSSSTGLSEGMGYKHAFNALKDLVHGGDMKAAIKDVLVRRGSR